MLGTGEGDAKALLKRVKIISPAKRPVSTQFFEMMGEALLNRRQLHMRYLTRGHGEVGERDVSPQRLVHYRNTSYLYAWCHTRERLLQFALDAIEEATAFAAAKAKEVSLKQVEADMDGGCGTYSGAKRHWAKVDRPASGCAVDQPRGVAPGPAGPLARRWLVRTSDSLRRRNRDRHGCAQARRSGDGRRARIARISCARPAERCLASIRTGLAVSDLHHHGHRQRLRERFIRPGPRTRRYATGAGASPRRPVPRGTTFG